MQSKTAAGQLVGQATDEQIEKWKKEHALGIFAYKGKGHIAYFREPDRDDVNIALSKIENAKKLAATEELGELLFIGGSKKVLEDDQIFLGFSPKLSKKMDGLEGELVNL